MRVDYDGLFVSLAIAGFFGWRLVSAHRTGRLWLRLGVMDRTSNPIGFCIACALLSAMFGVGVLGVAFSLQLPKALALAVGGAAISGAMAPILRWYYPRN